MTFKQHIVWKKTIRVHGNQVIHWIFSKILFFNIFIQAISLVVSNSLQKLSLFQEQILLR